MAKIPKISSTAYRVLLLMRLLNESDHSIEDLNKIFSNDPHIARTFSKEVIIKYITTLRLAGYKISKPGAGNKYKYRLLKSPILLKPDNDSIKILAALEKNVSELYQLRFKRSYDTFLSKISRYLSEEHINLLNQERKSIKTKNEIGKSRYSEYSTLIQQLEKYCIEDQRIIVKYKNPPDMDENKVVLEPKGLKYTSDGVYLSGYNPIIAEKQVLSLNYINDIKQLPVKSKSNYVLSPVIFKLKGRLAKGYRPYDGEKITETDKKNGNITVSSSIDDKTMLLQRLLKYGEHCEVIYPKATRKNMINIIQSTLDNYKN